MPRITAKSLVFMSFLAASQRLGGQLQPQPGLDRPQKSATAVKVASGAINVDGKLNEATWAAIVPIQDFVQKDPIEGAAPSDRMEIRIAYDEDALYVGTRVI